MRAQATCWPPAARRLLSLQKDRRKAVKFRPAAQRLEMLVAEDYGSGMAALPVKRLGPRSPEWAGLIRSRPECPSLRRSRPANWSTRSPSCASRPSASAIRPRRPMSARSWRCWRRRPASTCRESAEIARLTEELTIVNAALWDVEDGKRDCERRQDFGPDFVALARRVYIENDQRAAIKRAINAAADRTSSRKRATSPISEPESDASRQRNAGKCSPCTPELKSGQYVFCAAGDRRLDARAAAGHVPRGGRRQPDPRASSARRRGFPSTGADGPDHA